MQSLSFRDALTKIQQELRILAQKKDSRNSLLAVAGYVASGKSRFCSILRSDVEVFFEKPPIYLPFDLWINVGKRNAVSYVERFFLTDLIEAVRCIRNGKRFLVPRYDIVKLFGYFGNDLQRSTQELLWNERLFLRYSTCIEAPLIVGATDLYVDAESGYPYSLFPAIVGECFLLDGTLVAPREIGDYYDVRIFVQAPWPMRIARMIRRFNRKEVFGSTKKTMRDYVGFLVTEARECADAEIRAQLDGQVIMVESIPDTISNYLDLAYLRWLTEQDNAPDWMDRHDVDVTMHKYLEYLQKVHDTETIVRHRSELTALIESKHFLALPGVDQILVELSTILR